MKEIEERLLTTKEAAVILGVKPATLARARVYGTPGYPDFVRIGRKTVRYKMSTVSALIQGQAELKKSSAA